MKDLTPLQIGDKIISVTGINLYENTRKKAFVEHRALLCYILRDKLQMRWTFIAAFFISQGKHMDHANCMHLFKMYPIYKKDNKTLDIIENIFAFKSKIPLDEIDKVNYLENKYGTLEAEYLKQKEQLKNPLVKLVIDIPDNKIVDAKDRIKLMKKSWEWK
tara:strand:- start:1000 stop:1482 length:483 start_codon:yes stop_codon:yes gene_type:complete